MTSELVTFGDFKFAKAKDKNQRFTLAATDAWCREKAGVTEWDLDVAACDESHLASKFYEECDDGLSKPWFGRVFCNPPFDNIAAWVLKAHDEIKRCEVIAMLLPSNRTEQPWFQEHVEQHRDGRGGHADFTLSTHFLPGRTRYGQPSDPLGLKVGSPPFGSVLLVWRRR